MRNGMIKKIVLWTLTLSVAVGIFVFSEQSAEQSSAISGAVTQGLLGSLFSFFKFTEAQQEFAHILIRGAAHVLSFALLGLFSALLVRCYSVKRWTWITFGSCAAYAVFDECHQLWINAGRAFELVDVAKDCIGALLGMALVAGVHRLVVRRRAKKQKQKEG